MHLCPLTRFPRRLSFRIKTESDRISDDDPARFACTLSGFFPNRFLQGIVQKAVLTHSALGQYNNQQKIPSSGVHAKAISVMAWPGLARPNCSCPSDLCPILYPPPA